MRLAWKIARRYFSAKRSHNLINIISKVSLIGVGIGAMGLIIVLSVFNGFGNLVLSMYNSFDPDIRITPVQGKSFLPDAANYNQLLKVEGVKDITITLEENALLRYRERQFIATMKGVSQNFFTTSAINSKIIDGNVVSVKDSSSFMIPGAQIAYSLGLRVNDPLYSVTVFMPLKGIDPSTAMLDPSQAFAQRSITATGVFSVQQDFDTKYVIVPINFMRELTGEDKIISALEVKLNEGANIETVQSSIEEIVGDNFEVKDRYRQHDFLYKVLRSEKAGVYLILGFILLIATFNIFGSLTMLIIDKKQDINTLMNMGASLSLIQQVFLIEGLLISLVGAIGGMFLGFVICLIQQYFGLIRLENSEGFITDSYPVAMQFNDFITVFAIVFVIGFIAAWFTSRIIVNRQVKLMHQ
jgi:lipoprotein-releasing system permease protein